MPNYHDLSIFEFKQAAFDCKRISHNNEKVFNRHVSMLVLNCMRKYFKAMKYFTNRVISFKNTLLTKLAKKVFDALKE